MNDALDRLRTALASRYRVERELGAGGMARVYEAEDLRHHRKVAIKVLRPELAEAVGAERFLREIETSAKLRHPHIVPLFDSGDADGSLFYVMPLVEGESLRSRLVRERQLPLEDALAIAREVADALAYAHKHGIIHRDIKPENILLESGHAVVADFGLARAITAADSGRPMALTGTGIALGTPRYMSPEQTAGARELDGRSDLYSLACTLYEMLAGAPPFQGPSVARLVFQHLAEPAPVITRIRPTVPASVSAALQRALAKTPEERFDTVEAFAGALRAAAAGPVPTAEHPVARSVAVLPFLNLSADPENEYFADGITEDVIAQLSKIRALRVVSRTSVMPFKKREQDLREIATRLQVGALLDGSVRRAGTRVRIVAQLVDAEADRQVWGETYDRELTDIFAIQSEVALQIAAALKATLTADERDRIGRPATNDVRAYQLYLQGRHHLHRFTEERMRRAIEDFEQAIARDPAFALAHASIAAGFTELAETGEMRPEEAYPPAKVAAARALALDGELAEAHTAQAYLKMVCDYDWAGAEAGFKRAIELNPSSADSYDLYGRLCSALSRHDEAIALQQRALELDPLAHKVDVATAYLRAGRYDEGLEAARRAVEFDGDDPRARSTLGWALLGQGRREAGFAELTRAVEVSDNSQWLAQLGQAHALHGEPARAREVLATLAERARTRFVSPYHLAYVYVGLGEYDTAMDLLENAFEQQTGAPYGIGGSFLFAPLRGEVRFRALLRKMNVG
ncbi:MAG: protein kinase domain-containing protein [Gemmatimonadales bacterium]